jgi:hypothetical protein
MGNVLTYPLNDGMIAISNAVKNSINTRMTARKKQVRLVHNAVDLKTLAALDVDHENARANLRIKKDHLIVGNVAHIQPQKGHIYLLRCQLIIDENPYCEFVFVEEKSTKLHLRTT